MTNTGLKSIWSLVNQSRVDSWPDWMLTRRMTVRLWVKHLQQIDHLLQLWESGRSCTLNGRAWQSVKAHCLHSLWNQEKIVWCKYLKDNQMLEHERLDEANWAKLSSSTDLLFRCHNVWSTRSLVEQLSLGLSFTDLLVSSLWIHFWSAHNF